MTKVFEFLSKLPVLRTQPKSTGFAARTEEAAPLARLLEQLEQSGASLHTSSKASLANRSRTSSMKSSSGLLTTSPGSLPEGEGGTLSPRAHVHGCTLCMHHLGFALYYAAPAVRQGVHRAAHAPACPHAQLPGWAVS